MNMFMSLPDIPVLLLHNKYNLSRINSISLRSTVEEIGDKHFKGEYTKIWWAFYFRILDNNNPVIDELIKSQDKSNMLIAFYMLFSDINFNNE